MDEQTIQKAWNECELEDAENVNGTLIDPAVFKPTSVEELQFNDRMSDKTPLWDNVKQMDNISCMTEPLDGFLRTTAYVYLDNEPAHTISLRTYPNRVKISPGDEDCSFEAFTKFIQEWEANVCQLQFLGGLDQMPTADE